jgi:hypothetical protein
METKNNWPMQRRRMRILLGSSNKMVPGCQGVILSNTIKKERIKLTAFEEKTAISHRNKEKEEQR